MADLIEARRQRRRTRLRSERFMRSVPRPRFPIGFQPDPFIPGNTIWAFRETTRWQRLLVRICKSWPGRQRWAKKLLIRSLTDDQWRAAKDHAAERRLTTLDWPCASGLTVAVSGATLAVTLA